MKSGVSLDKGILLPKHILVFHDMGHVCMDQCVGHMWEYFLQGMIQNSSMFVYSLIITYYLLVEHTIPKFFFSALQ